MGPSSAAEHKASTSLRQGHFRRSRGCNFRSVYILGILSLLLSQVGLVVFAASLMCFESVITEDMHFMYLQVIYSSSIYQPGQFLLAELNFELICHVDDLLI